MNEIFPGDAEKRLLEYRQKGAEIFRAQPHLSMAAAVFVLGLLAILTGLPTAAGSTTLAGALFGSGAAFIGAWVTERNKTAAEKAAEARRMEAARGFFAPELARVVAQQIHIVDRLAANFSETSMNRPSPGDHLTSFRPFRPVLFPASAQFRDLSEIGATYLIQFYDALQEITEIVDSWVASDTKMDVNAFNVLMQKAQHSLVIGRKAVEQFCPDQQYSPIMPSGGTLIEQLDRSVKGAQTMLGAHLKRHGAE